MKKTFAFSPDRKTRLYTGVILAFMTLVGVVTFLPTYNVYLRSEAPFPLINLLPLLLLTIIAAACYLYTPTACEITETALIIRRGVGRPSFPLAGITAVRRLEDNELKNCVRVFGVGGLFGSFGHYHSASLGPFILYARRTTGFVLVEADGRKIVLTPDEPDTFVTELNNARKAPNNPI